MSIPSSNFGMQDIYRELYWYPMSFPYDEFPGPEPNASPGDDTGTGLYWDVWNPVPDNYSHLGTSMFRLVGDSMLENRSIPCPVGRFAGYEHRNRYRLPMTPYQKTLMSGDNVVGDYYDAWRTKPDPQFHPGNYFESTYYLDRKGSTRVGHTTDFRWAYDVYGTYGTDNHPWSKWFLYKLIDFGELAAVGAPDYAEISEWSPITFRRRQNSLDNVGVAVDVYYNAKTDKWYFYDPLLVDPYDPDLATLLHHTQPFRVSDGTERMDDLQKYWGDSWYEFNNGDIDLSSASPTLEEIGVRIYVCEEGHTPGGATFFSGTLSRPTGSDATDRTFYWTQGPNSGSKVTTGASTGPVQIYWQDSGSWVHIHAPFPYPETGWYEYSNGIKGDANTCGGSST